MKALVTISCSCGGWIRRVAGHRELADFLRDHDEHCTCDKRMPPHAPHMHATTIGVAS